MKSFSDRLRYLIDYKGFSNTKMFASYLGYNSAEKIARLLRDDSAKPSFDILADIMNHFDDVNMTWLILGEGNIDSKRDKVKEYKEIESNVDTLNESEPEYIYNGNNNRIGSFQMVNLRLKYL